MRKLKKIVNCLLLSCLMATLSIQPMAQELAKQTFQETSVSMPTKADKEYLMNLYAHASGTIDYLAYSSKGSGSSRKTTYTHYNSADAGKTWKTKSTAWITTLNQKYTHSLSMPISNVFVNEKGDIYCIFPVSTAEKKVGRNQLTYYNFKIFKVTNGVVAEIPNLSLSGASISEYKVVATLENGDLAICGKGITNEIEKTGSVFYAVNPATGKITATLNLPSRSIPTAYANGKVYGIGISNEAVGKADFNFIEYDLKSGKKTSDIFLKMWPLEDMVRQMCVNKNGVAYVTSQSGLFKRTPGASNFIKVLDGPACKLGNDAACELIVCDTNGNVYAPMYHLNLKNSDPLNYTYKLYRYQPTA